MTRSELTNSVAKQTGHQPEEIERVLDCTLKAIKQQMAKGDGVYIRGFGAFIPKKRAAKIGQNINAGTPVNIPERLIPSFKPCRNLKNAIGKN